MKINFNKAKSSKAKIIQPTTKTEKKAPKKNTLPPDTYKPMFTPVRLLVREFEDKNGEEVKQYLEISAKRFDRDETHVENLGTPYFWISMYQEAPTYTGYLKGKTVYAPMEELFSFTECIDEFIDRCEEENV